MEGLGSKTLVARMSPACGGYLAERVLIDFPRSYGDNIGGINVIRYNLFVCAT